MTTRYLTNRRDRGGGSDKGRVGVGMWVERMGIAFLDVGKS